MNRRYCIIITAIQFTIAFLFYLIGFLRVIEFNRFVIDILGGISWTMTAIWWLYAALDSEDD